MSDYDWIGASGANNHYCLGVLGRNTHDGNIFLYYCPGVLGGNTHDGNIFLYYCSGVLGGNTYDGYILTVP
ncbi:hypothetical protein Tco_0236170 [Tanacetum coccineum]